MQILESENINTGINDLQQNLHYQSVMSCGVNIASTISGLATYYQEGRGISVFIELPVCILDFLFSSSDLLLVVCCMPFLWIGGMGGPASYWHHMMTVTSHTPGCRTTLTTRNLGRIIHISLGL
jgi:hypothetical protein